MYAKKAAESNHISIEEGAIIVDTIKEEFPVTIKMLESKSKFAEKYGFIIINNRTNSRAWFPYTIKKLKGHINPEEYFAQLNGEYNDARNICIQGTQADFLKEATVEIQKWIDDNGYNKEIVMLSWIHDEIVDQHPNYLNGKSDEWKEWNANGNVLSVSLSTGETKTFFDFPALKGYIMEQVANRYLENNIEIKVDYDVLKYWTK